MVYSLKEFQNSSLASGPHFFVIGHPISHSLSPLMHQTSLDYYDIRARYVALDLRPDEITSFISWCNRDEFAGCNITIPYKEEMMNIVDETDTFAKQVGVINTIAKHHGKLKGFNTDVFGFTTPAQSFFEQRESNRAIIFGTGGASKAVKIALEKAGFEELIFVTRNIRGKVIQSSARVEIINYAQWPAFAEETSLFVNTTPLGMMPNTKQSPVHANEAYLLEGKICYDLVYNPEHTLFLKLAAGHGATAITGIDMLIWQGSKSFEIWTGKPFPYDLVKEKLNHHFNKP